MREVTAGDDALLRYRLRAVKVAVQTTLLAIAVPASYPFLRGAPRVPTASYAGLVVAAGGGALVIGRLPWERILRSPRGTSALYGWSILDIALITYGLMLTGGSTSSLFWLYILTT